MSEKPDQDRIIFHTKDQIMEVDFSDVLFDSADQVNRFYDLVDEKITATGQGKWYFLVNYKNCQLTMSAWIPFANRGKKVNIASSLGSARFAVSDETGKNILNRSEKENFDPNLFSSRQAALEHLRQMKKKADQGGEKTEESIHANDPGLAARSIVNRITFHDDLEIMEVDFSNFTFDGLPIVNEFYDLLTARIQATDRKWYFLVNYDNTRIFPDAWYQWAIRSRRLNSDWSLGTVRFKPDEATKSEILKRAATNETDPNLVTTRQQALDRIAQMRST